MKAPRRQREMRPAEEQRERNQNKQATVFQVEWLRRRPIVSENLPNSQDEEHQHPIEQQSARIGPPPDASVQRPEQLEGDHGRRGLIPDFLYSGCRFTKDVVACRRKRGRGVKRDALAPSRWLTAPGHSNCPCLRRARSAER